MTTAGDRPAKAATTTGSATASVHGSYEGKMLTSDDIERTGASRQEGQGQGGPSPDRSPSR